MIHNTSTNLETKIRKRIYCCGVFDMMHIGHMEMFKYLSNYGDVIVGVLSDETTASYKRLPVMTHSERCKTVAAAKYVVEVIENCPLDTSSVFIKKHKIDLVGVGEEYYTKIDEMKKYYSACVDVSGIDTILKKNIIVVIPRYNGISSSDLIKRIKFRSDL